MADDDSDEASAAPVCWFCKQEVCWKHNPLEDIFDEVKDDEEMSNRKKIRHCLERGEQFCNQQGGRPDGAVPFVDGRVPFCMWEAIFNKFPTKCPGDCERTPCAFLQEAKQQGTVLAAIDGIDGGMVPNEVRFMLYTKYTSLIWGCLGKGNRRRLPKCVHKMISQLFPNVNGEPPVGFKEAPENI